MTAPRNPTDPRSATDGEVRLPPEPGELAFDRWVRDELGRLYDATLSEPVPEELLRLLDPDPERN
ncbi:hypothetical protein M0638_01395 [Roseomonas sp. NAR14]|uniref:Anti-sigma factor NepR domain-containing protein n=2 Tax=Roseomonas acroporae TaxID=2937791 RepID=A0A9X1Y6A4_9PROT|nr:hypothetical protein [Roseomonas acroporae]